MRRRWPHRRILAGHLPHSGQNQGDAAGPSFSFARSLDDDDVLSDDCLSVWILVMVCLNVGVLLGLCNELFGGEFVFGLVLGDVGKVCRCKKVCRSDFILIFFS